jgi:hypothetical protein
MADARKEDRTAPMTTLTADLRHARIDSIDALIHATDLAREIYDTPKPAILGIRLTREQYDQTRTRIQQQMKFFVLPRNGVIRWFNLDLYTDEPESHAEKLEHLGPLNEPFPLACEHHFAPINKNRTGACKCVRCGLVAHNVIPSLRG